MLDSPPTLAATVECKSLGVQELTVDVQLHSGAWGLSVPGFSRVCLSETNSAQQSRGAGQVGGEGGG